MQHIYSQNRGETMSENIKKMIGETFKDIAKAIETGSFAAGIRVGITTLGSEHGVENLVAGAEMAAKESAGFEIVLIGPKVDTELEVAEVATEEEAHKKMEELLDSGYLSACVTMHYNFPIGVSTVGRVITPGKGKEMFIATTTGTSAAHRVEAMVKNAIYGIITAKAMGKKNPTVGILNLDGARAVERALKELDKNGYPITFAESMRADGGCVMRGNDLLGAAADVMVTDTLTGNIMMKVFSSYTTGGSYEGLGYGYGPGIGEGYDRTVLILSRASGTPVAANAIKYAAKLSAGNVKKIAAEEFKKAKAAGLEDILSALTATKKEAVEEEVKMPEKEVVTASIAGIDVMDLEDAQKALWKAGIYAETGMGCTGPMVQMSEANLEASKKILADAGYIA